MNRQFVNIKYKFPCKNLTKSDQDVDQMEKAQNESTFQQFEFKDEELLYAV